MTNLYLILGLPGSGKSTFARAISAVRVEADSYFTDKFGEYKFNPSRIRQAHEWCQSTTRHYLARGNDVAVCNTFTQMWEMEPYIKMAHDLGARLTVVRVEGTHGNIHGVPQASVERMAARWEDFSG